MYTEQDLDVAYNDGMEDLGQKIIELIRQSDYEIELDEIESFIEHELEFKGVVDGRDDDFPEELRMKSWVRELPF
jgi:hypothetical protein